MGFLLDTFRDDIHLVLVLKVAQVLDVRVLFGHLIRQHCRVGDLRLLLLLVILKLCSQVFIVLNLSIEVDSFKDKFLHVERGSDLLDLSWALADLALRGKVLV